MDDCLTPPVHGKDLSTTLSQEMNRKQHRLKVKIQMNTKIFLFSGCRIPNKHDL